MLNPNGSLARPLPTTEIGAAYVQLVLAVAACTPGLLHTYLGPPQWQPSQPPSLAAVRDQAVALATAVQNSGLPRHRRERLLRNVRALLWLIRAQLGESIIFSEQVRLLLDLRPESVDEAFFQAAHEALAAALGSTGDLAEAWWAWQANHSLPAQAALPLLQRAVADLGTRIGSLLPLHEMDVVLAPAGRDLQYRPGVLVIPAELLLRVDRLCHLAARWGHGGIHSLHTAIHARYADGRGDVECAVVLNMGPDQVIATGLPEALLKRIDFYESALPLLLEAAGVPAIAPERLRAIHVAEDMLQWAQAKAALLQHAEGLRPRAVRRHLMRNALLTVASADRQLAELAEPARAAHVFAPLVGGPLIDAWLAQTGHTPGQLLADPPVPSSMLFEVRFSG